MADEICYLLQTDSIEIVANNCPLSVLKLENLKEYHVPNQKPQIVRRFK